MTILTHRFLLFLLFILLNLSACNGIALSRDVSANISQAQAEKAATGTAAPTVSVDDNSPIIPTATSPAITLTPTDIPTQPPTPTATPAVHTVQAGDTLITIALAYSTTVQAVAQANDLNEEDLLQIGQQLIIVSAAAAPSTSLFPVKITLTPQAQLLITPTQTTTATDLNASNTPDSPANSSVAETVAAPTAVIATIVQPVPDISHAANINPLTGLSVADGTTLQRRPIMVRIGNDVGARQAQAGFNQADVVYEEIAEWWLTRFTAVYLSETPKVVAPVRSARLINVLLTPQYQAALVNSGGSDPVRWEISQAPFINLDEFFHPTPYFYRPNQGWQTRLAVDIESTRNYMVAKAMEADVNLQGFRFADAIPSGEPIANFTIPYPQATSFTEWRYDSARGKYLRWIKGSPLVDMNDGLQVSATNVIVYFAPHQETDIVEDSNGATAIRMLVNGRGPAMFFRDGLFNQGFWQTDGSRPPYFTLEDGSPYDLKPGNSWIQVVPLNFQIGLTDAE